MNVLIQLAEPLLSPIRHILPAMGGMGTCRVILRLRTVVMCVNMGIAEPAAGNMLLPGLWWRYECCDSLRRRILVLRLYIQPKPAATVSGNCGDEVKVAYFRAPPVDGRANSHLIKFLGKRFRVAKRSDRHRKGELGRHKW